jgi:hypothetical protein
MRKPAPLSRAARQAAAGAITGRAPAWTPSTAQNDHVSKAGLSVPRLARPVPLDVVRTADGRLGLFCREQPYQGPAPSLSGVSKMSWIRFLILRRRTKREFSSCCKTALPRCLEQQLSLRRNAAQFNE